MMKKMMMMLLPILLVFTSIPVTFAGFDPCAGTDFTCTVSEMNVTLKDYTGSETEIVIPDGVTWINDRALDNKGFTSVTIPASVTNIRNQAFEKNKLTEVIFKDRTQALTLNGPLIFANNNLTSVTMPKGVTAMQSTIFDGNPLLEHIKFLSVDEQNENGTYHFKNVNEKFEGWYTDENLDNKWNNKFETGELNLYAKRKPNPPTDVTAQAGDRSANVSFTGPTHAKHNNAMEYTVHAYVNGTKQQESSTGTESPIKVTGLTNYTDYTFKVIATNKAGNSVESVPSPKVTPSLYEFVDNGDGVTITKYLGSETEIEIPNTLDGKTVTAIGERALANHRLKSVTIPASVTTIANEAFFDNQLEHIKFEGSPTIGASAFETTNFPEFIEWYTDESLNTEWDGTSAPPGGTVYAMRKPNPPTNVTAAVGDGKVTVSFTGPEHIGGNAVTKYTVKVFKDGTEQSNLETSGNTSPITVTGLTHETNYTFKVTAKNKAGDSVESSATDAVEAVVFYETTNNDDGTVTITKYNGPATDVETPSEIDGKIVSQIGMFAFMNKQLTSVTIPESVEIIESSAFSNNQLTSVTTPESVTVIGARAFSNNPLTSVTIQGKASIGVFAFENNTLTSLTITDGVTEIGEGAFKTNKQNQLTSITIPGSVKSIGKNAFEGSVQAGWGNELTSVTIQEGVETIGDLSFGMNLLTSVTIPNTVTEIGAYAFHANKLTSVTIPENMESIGTFAFAYNQLEEIIFEGTPELGTDAFKQSWDFYKEFKGWYTDPEFTSVWDGTTVPDEKKLYGKRTPNPPTEVSVVAGVEEATVSFTGPTHLGGNAVTGYSVKVYEDGIEQEGLEANGTSSPITVTGLTNGKAYTFKVIAMNAAGNSEDSLTSDAITPKVKYETTINEDGTVTITGYNGTEKDVEIPSKINGMDVTAIGDDAFKEKGLTNVDIPNTVRSIGKHAFSSNKITVVELKSGLSEVGDYAFSSNELTSLEIPGSLNTIGENAFSHNKLTSMEIPNSVGKVGSYAFSYNRLTSVTINPGTYEWGKGAFSHNELESVTIAMGISKIADSAFSHNKLTNITFPPTVNTIGENAFASNRLERVTFNSEPLIGTDAFDQDDASVFPEFVGWYTDADLQNEWDGTSAPEGKELHAKRKPNQTTAVTAKAGNGKATISFTGPTHTGGNVVTGYTVKVYDTDGTEISELETTGTVSPITVTGLTSGKAYTFKVIATNAAGDSEDSVSTAIVTPTAPSNNNGGTGGGGNSGGSTGGGGSSPTKPSTPNEPEEQSRNVNIDFGKGTNNTANVQVEIKRTTAADAKQVDNVSLNKETIKSIVQGAMGGKQTLARIVIDDIPGKPADKVTVNIPTDAVKELEKGGISLELQTEDAKVTIPKESLKGLQQLNKDLFFNIVPVREESEKKLIEKRTVNATEVLKFAGNNKVTTHGKPMTIETNYTAHPTKVVFPLKNVQLPTNQVERKALLDSLAVYIEHSDGEKKVQKGKVIYDEEGNPEGLEIEISKFSTFTVISIKQENELVCEKQVTDIAGHWAMESICELISLGAVTGYPDKTFKPHKPVTRAEFVAMLTGALNLKEENQSATTFTDIQTHWAKQIIEVAASHQIVNGMSQDIFGPDKQITREQMAVMIVNAGKFEVIKSKTSFKDSNAVADWAKDAVNTAYHNKMINGFPNNTFTPKGQATRAEAATVIMNLLEVNN